MGAVAHKSPVPQRFLTVGAVAITIMSLDPNLVIRDLVASDYHKGYLQVLAGLTTVGEISEKQFVEQLAELRQSGELHQMIVIEQLSTGRVVAAGTLFVERKWIHSCGRVGHIEDIVADKALKGHRLGSRIIAELVRRGRAAGLLPPPSAHSLL